MIASSMPINLNSVSYHPDHFPLDRSPTTAL
jgi:hypothetical protein